MDVPLHPNDVKAIELREQEKLVKDRRNYIKTILKRNFDKYRKEDRGTIKEEFDRELSAAAPGGQMDQKSVSFAVNPT